MSPGQAELARTPLLQASPSNSQCELPVATFGGVLADRRTVALGTRPSFRMGATLSDRRSEDLCEAWSSTIWSDVGDDAVVFGKAREARVVEASNINTQRYKYYIQVLHRYIFL